MKLTIGDLMGITAGLNTLSNSGVSFSSMKLSFELAKFKKDSQNTIEAFKEANDGKEVKKEELDALLAEETELKFPKVTIKDLESATGDVPLLAFDYLIDYIEK